MHLKQLLPTRLKRLLPTRLKRLLPTRLKQLLSIRGVLLLLEVVDRTPNQYSMSPTSLITLTLISHSNILLELHPLRQCGSWSHQRAGR